MSTSEDQVVRISKKKFLGGIVVIIVILALWIASRSATTINYAERMSVPATSAPSVGMETGGGAMMPEPYPNYYRGEPDITDTREFMKTSYSAEIKTVDVRSMQRNVKSVVREADGRIDSESVSNERGYLRFVVPATKFESFRAEIEHLTYAKLYTENISSENLLGQKQGIEEQTANQAEYLAQLQQEKKSLDSTHASKLATYKKELADVVSQLSSTRVKANNAQTADERALYQMQETTLVARESTLRQSIAAENKSYGTRSAELANKITTTNSYLTNLSEQDTDLLNNVATVSGSISVEKTSWWMLAVLLLPVHPGWIILILVLLFWYILRRIGVLPRVEFV